MVATHSFVSDIDEIDSRPSATSVKAEVAAVIMAHSCTACLAWRAIDCGVGHGAMNVGGRGGGGSRRRAVGCRWE